MTIKHTESFKRKIWIIFALMGFIPFIVAVYLLALKEIEITQEVYAIGALVFVGILTSFFMVVHFAEDLSALSEKTTSVVGSTKKIPIKASDDSVSEVDILANNFNKIIEELHTSKADSKKINTRLLVYANELRKYQEKLRREALIRAKLSRYVGGHVLDHLVKDGVNFPIKNVRREVTVLFADIRSFTTLSEHMASEHVIEMLNEYFSAMVEVIFKHNGVLDKFVGDELMAVFGMIEPHDNAPLDAVKAALEMRKAHKALMQQRIQQGKVTFEIGTGVNTGEAVVGNVGAKNRSDFTVIGDTVNVGARFEQMAAGQEIIVGELTYQRCKHIINMSKKDEIAVRNRSQKVACYIVND